MINDRLHFVRFNQHRELIHQNLYCVNPTVAQIHQLWDSYSDVNLISIEELTHHRGAYDLFDFTVNFFFQHNSNGTLCVCHTPDMTVLLKTVYRKLSHRKFKSRTNDSWTNGTEQSKTFYSEEWNESMCQMRALDRKRPKNLCLRWLPWWLKIYQTLPYGA